jgi:hypothetical protein
MGKDHEPVVMLLLEDHKAMEKTSYLLVSLPAAVPLIFAGNRLAPPMARTPLQLPPEQYERVRCWTLTPIATLSG